MTTYKTGNPLGSVSPKDLFDNSENLDRAVNGVALIWKDRFDRSRLSWAGIEDRARIDTEAAATAAVAVATAQAGEYRDEAQQARDDAVAAAAASGEFVFVETYADAITKLPLPEGTVVEVGRDEQHVDSRTRYLVEDSTLRFVINLDLLRIALAEPGGASLVGYRRLGGVPRTQQSKNDDVVSILDFIDTPVDGVTSNQDGIVKAISYCHQTGAKLFWPAGSYVSTDNIPHFHQIRHTGQGILRRGEIRFVIRPEGKGPFTNDIHVSPLGAAQNDGLSPEHPLSTIQAGLDALSNAGPYLVGNWRVVLAPGVYKSGGAISDVRSNDYITLISTGSTTEYQPAVIDLEGESASYGLSFSRGMRVQCRGIKVRNVANGSGAESGFLIDAGTTGYFIHCASENTGQYGINANIRCRLLVAGGSFENVRTGLRVYGNSTAYIGYNGVRVSVSECAVGVDTSGSSYSHADFIDFKRCDYGLQSRYQSHSTNYDTTFEDVRVGWETDGSSTVNSARYQFINAASVAKCRSLLGGAGTDDQLDSPSKYTRNIVFYPGLGPAGRWSYGYPSLTAPFREHQYLIGGQGSGVNMSTAANVGFAIDAGATNYLGLYAPSGGFSGIAFGDQNSANGFVIRHQAGQLSLNVGTTFTYRFNASVFGPAIDNTVDLGSASTRVKQVYAATGTINTSDAREKSEPLPIDDALLDAWGDVQFVAFQWLSQIQVKGDAARWHFGVIAQQVRDVFTARGIDGTRYGLLCYDEWESQPAQYEEIPAEIDEETGDVIRDSYKQLVSAEIPAGNRWGIRADQCMFLEAAYQRRELRQLREALQSILG